MVVSARGFTLIELLVVFSIIIILSTGSIVAYNSYNASQKLAISAKQFATVLQKAKFQAQNQIVPSLSSPSVCDKLIAYEVRVCTKASPLCVTSGTDYEIDVVCEAGTYSVDSYTLPSEVTIDALRTNTGNIQFHLLTAGVSGSGSVFFMLSSDKEKSVIINSQGVIQLN